MEVVGAAVPGAVLLRAAPLRVSHRERADVVRMEVHADADGERHAHRIGAAERDAEDQLQYLVDRQDEQQRGEDGQRGRDEPEEVVIRRGSLFGETQIGFDHSSGLSVWNRLWSVGPQDVGGVFIFCISRSCSATAVPRRPAPGSEGFLVRRAAGPAYARAGRWPRRSWPLSGG